MTFNGRSYGLGALFVVIALVLTIVAAALHQLEFLPIGLILLLIELGVLVT